MTIRVTSKDYPNVFLVPDEGVVRIHFRGLLVDMTLLAAEQLGDRILREAKLGRTKAERGLGE